MQAIRHISLGLAATGLFLGSSATASAAPEEAKAGEHLPAPLEAMLREAQKNERDTVENIAKRLYPAYRDEIDDLIDDIEDAEQAQAGKDELSRGWRGEISAGANWSSGNTDSKGVNVSFDVERETTHEKHRIAGYLDLASQDGESITERMGLGYRARRDFGETPWFGLGLLTYERDAFQGIERRFTEMAGIGYQLIDNDTMTLEVSTGPALRQSLFTGKDPEDRIAWAGGGELDYDITDTLNFTQYIFVAIDEGNSSAVSVSTFTSNIYGHISGKVSFTADYESDAAEGTKRLDTRGLLSIALEL